MHSHTQWNIHAAAASVRPECPFPLSVTIATSTSTTQPHPHTRNVSACNAQHLTVTKHSLQSYGFCTNTRSHYRSDGRWIVIREVIFTASNCCFGVLTTLIFYNIISYISSMAYSYASLDWFTHSHAFPTDRLANYFDLISLTLWKQILDADLSNISKHESISVPVHCIICRELHVVRENHVVTAGTKTGT